MVGWGGGVGGGKVRETGPPRIDRMSPEKSFAFPMKEKVVSFEIKDGNWTPGEGGGGGGGGNGGAEGGRGRGEEGGG